MSSRYVNDFAQTVRIDALTQDHVTRKLRMVGRYAQTCLYPRDLSQTFIFRLKFYDAENAFICIADEQDTLLVDISLCLNGFRPFPWLREENATIMVIGYLETLEETFSVCLNLCNSKVKLS